MTREHLKPGLRAVFLRELHRMTLRRLYFGVSVVLPLFTIFFMATVFNKGVMEEIPVAVIDHDNTSTSRTIVRNMRSVPTFQVTGGYTNEAEARKALQARKIYGYLVIPYHFEQDATSGRNATLAYYYHYALLSVGGELLAAFETSLAPVQLAPVATRAVALGVSEEQTETFLLPVQADSRPVYNPGLDYTIYLTHPFFYVLFQILILLTTVYIIGIEIKFHSATLWLGTAGGDILKAVTGKLLPYTIIYSVIAILANFVFFGIMHIPFDGSYLILNLVSILFIIATQCFAVLIFSLFPAIAIIISIGSMVGSLGATLSGVTFPVPNMYPLVYGASFLFPIRHYTLIVQNMFYLQGSYVYYWPSVIVLCIFPLLALFILPRLSRAIFSHKYEEIE